MRNDCGNCIFARICKQQSCAAGRPTPWHETPEEIEAGLAWGERKEYLTEWVRYHMRKVLLRSQQNTVSLYLFHGMTFDQVAKVTGVDKSVVCKRMKQSVERLRWLWKAEQKTIAKSSRGSGKSRAKRGQPRGGKSSGPA